MRLTWNGPEIKLKMALAATVGIDNTMAKAVEHAKDHHPSYPPASEPFARYANRTGFETGSIQIFEGAKLEGDEVSGQWGADANYSLYLEIGTSLAAPTAPERAAMGEDDPSLIPPPMPPLMQPRPFLRPAADSEYVWLSLRIAAAYQGESLP